MGSRDLVFRWRRSSSSASSGQCVELSRAGAVRDSKHAGGPVIHADVTSLVGVVKAGVLSRSGRPTR